MAICLGIAPCWVLQGQFCEQPRAKSWSWVKRISYLKVFYTLANTVSLKLANFVLTGFLCCRKHRHLCSVRWTPGPGWRALGCGWTQQRPPRKAFLQGQSPLLVRQAVARFVPLELLKWSWSQHSTFILCLFHPRGMSWFLKYALYVLVNKEQSKIIKKEPATAVQEEAVQAKPTTKTRGSAGRHEKPTAGDRVSLVASKRKAVGTLGRRKRKKQKTDLTAWVPGFPS